MQMITKGYGLSFQGNKYDLKLITVMEAQCRKYSKMLWHVNYVAINTQYIYIYIYIHTYIHLSII